MAVDAREQTVSWNISDDGHRTPLDNDLRSPWWWKDGPKDDLNGIRASLENAPDIQPGVGTARITGEDTVTGRP